MPLLKRIVLGRVVGAHGLDGELRVRIAGDGPEHLLGVEVVWLAGDTDDPEARCYDVLGAGTGRGGEVRLSLDGIRDRDTAAGLLGRFVLCDARVLSPLPDGEYYWHQLIGCQVESDDGEQVGRVREIWATGGHDVLVIDGEDGRQRLVPTAAEVMTRVDLDAKRITVAVIDGLLDPS